MIRVGFGVTALAKAQTGGAHDGLSHYTDELLTRFDVKSEVVCAPFSFDIPLPSNYLRAVSLDHSSHPYTLSAYPRAAAWSALSGRPFTGIGQLESSVDLIHATDHHIPKSLSIPVVATLMDAIPLSHPEWSSGSFRSIKNALWLRAIQWADRVITISQYSKNELVTWAGIHPNKIDVISLGVDRRWFGDVTPEVFAKVRHTYRLPDSFFISVGTLQPRKNVKATIEAHRSLTAAQRARFPLVIVGRAGWKCEEVVQMIEQDSASGAIRWLKQVSDQDLLAILKLARGLVFPSLAEGFGLPVLEAFAAEVPVITSNTSSLPEVAGDAALCISPTDIAAITVGMQQLIDDETLHQSLKQKGLLRAKQFSWDACASDTIKCYQALLGAKDQPAP